MTAIDPTVSDRLATYGLTHKPGPGARLSLSAGDVSVGLASPAEAQALLGVLNGADPVAQTLWLYDDRTVAAMLHEARSFATDPGNDDDLRDSVRLALVDLGQQANMRGVEAAPLPAADPSCLLPALEQARLDMIAEWLAAPGREGLSWVEAVTRDGMPAHIDRVQVALRLSCPTA